MYDGPMADNVKGDTTSASRNESARAPSASPRPRCAIALAAGSVHGAGSLNHRLLQRLADHTAHDPPGRNGRCGPGLRVPAHARPLRAHLPRATAAQDHRLPLQQRLFDRGQDRRDCFVGLAEVHPSSAVIRWTSSAFRILPRSLFPTKPPWAAPVAARTRWAWARLDWLGPDPVEHERSGEGNHRQGGAVNRAASPGVALRSPSSPLPRQSRAWLPPRVGCCEAGPQRVQVWHCTDRSEASILSRPSSKPASPHWCQRLGDPGGKVVSSKSLF